MLNKMYAKLLKEGFSRKTLSKLSEKQISVLLKKIISEQGVAQKLGQLTPEIENVKKELSAIQNMVSDLVGEDDNEEEMDDDNQLTQTQKSNDGLDPDQRVSSLDKGPSDYGNNPEDDQVMDKNDADGMSIESEIKERAFSKQQKFAGTKQKAPAKDKEMSYGDKVRQIEESLLSLVKKYTAETMTKKDLLGLLESPGTKEAPTKDPKTVPGKPDRKTPYQPKHQPKPKARLPKELSFDELNITFKDEKKD